MHLLYTFFVKRSEKVGEGRKLVNSTIMQFGRPQVPSPKKAGGLVTAALMAGFVSGCENPKFSPDMPKEAQLEGSLTDSTVLVGGDRAFTVDVESAIPVNLELSGCVPFASADFQEGDLTVLDSVECSYVYVSLGNGRINFQVGNSETLQATLTGGVDIELEDVEFTFGRKKVEVLTFLDTAYADYLDEDEEGVDYVLLTGDPEIDSQYEDWTYSDGKQAKALTVEIEMQLNPHLSGADVTVNVLGKDIAIVPVSTPGDSIGISDMSTGKEDNTKM